jgi:hypothetical protein
MDIGPSLALYEQKVAKVKSCNSYAGGVVLNFITKDNSGNVNSG